jgi:TPR repeat protein
MYAEGRGVSQNDVEALQWFRRAANQGNADAQFNLGVMYANGQGVPQDEAEAVKWYRLAADQGNAYARTNLGLMYAGGRGVPQDSSEAVKWYRLAADQDAAAAEYNLGEAYRDGRGVPQNYTEAIKLFRRAADQGDADAQSAYEMLLNQTKVKREEEDHPGKAAVRRETWPAASCPVIETINRVLRAAGERFDGLTLTNTKNYFTVHLSGEGARTRTDWCFHPKGQFFLMDIRQPRLPVWDKRLSSIRGLELLEYNKNSGGRYRLKVFPTCGQDAISAIVDLASKALSRKAHSRKASKANASVAEEHGNITQDETDAQKYAVRTDQEDASAEAVKECRRAAEQGDAAAQSNLGLMYDEGRGAAQDYTEALKWYRRAAEQNNATAQYNLGAMYEEGHGVLQDDAEAVKWFRRAADQGDADAQYNLGLMYEKGRGVSQDDAEALKWCRRAADQGNAEAVRWLRQHRAHPEPDAVLARVRGLGTSADDKPSASSAHGPLLTDNSFLQLLTAAKSIAKASKKQQLTPLLFLCAVSFLRGGFAVSLAPGNEGIVRREAEKQGIKLVGVDIEASEEKMPLSADLKTILSGNLNSSISTFIEALLAELDTRTVNESSAAAEERDANNQPASEVQQIAERGEAQSAEENAKDDAPRNEGFWTTLGKQIVQSLMSAATSRPEKKPIRHGHTDEVSSAQLNADQTDAEAQFNLGVKYLLGQGVPQDDTEAMKWFRRAAEQGHVNAQSNLGVMYDKGQGVPQDYAEALKWLRQAAEQGYCGAESNLGVMYLEGRGVPQDYTEALKWFRQAADEGYAEAQFKLGNMCRDGQGMPQDDTEALQWYRRAADQGHDSAQYNLGVMYFNGQGVPQDYAEALQWFRRAADQGHVDAQYNLGVMYANGQGVPQDYILAYMWTGLSAAAGAQDGASSLQFIRRQMTPKQIAKARRLAIDWRPKSE